MVGDPDVKGSREKIRFSINVFDDTFSRSLGPAGKASRTGLNAVIVGNDSAVWIIRFDFFPFFGGKVMNQKVHRFLLFFVCEAFEGSEIVIVIGMHRFVFRFLFIGKDPVEGISAAGTPGVTDT